MLDTTEGIMRLRGKWTSLRLDDGSDLPTLPTFHPAYLLRNPPAKREVWEDMKKVMELLQGGPGRAGPDRDRWLDQPGGGQLRARIDRACA